MPRDVICREVATPDLATPTLSALAYILRHKETWPADWQWDFATLSSKRGDRTCGCALGIGNGRWPQFSETLVRFLLQLPHERAVWIAGIFSMFASSKAVSLYGEPLCSVTPTMVAEQIDKYIAAHGDLAW